MHMSGAFVVFAVSAYRTEPLLVLSFKVYTLQAHRQGYRHA